METFCNDEHSSMLLQNVIIFVHHTRILPAGNYIQFYFLRYVIFHRLILNILIQYCLWKHNHKCSRNQKNNKIFIQFNQEGKICLTKTIKFGILWFEVITLFILSNEFNTIYPSVSSYIVGIYQLPEVYNQADNIPECCK